MLLNEWREANLREVAKLFPQFEAIELPLESGAVQAWKGIIRPFSSDVDLGPIFEDLAADRDVFVHQGSLFHDSGCAVLHTTAPPFLEGFTAAGALFDLRVVAFAPPRDPRVYSTNPTISVQTYRYHPHLNADGSICPYPPHQQVLPWGGDTIVSLLQFTAIWLAKHMLWLHTGATLDSLWIGDAAPHDPVSILREVAPRDPCPCGSGLRFRSCHMPQVEEQVKGWHRFVEASLRRPHLS